MSGFGGTVKLTGESEYRKALSEITSNLKVLNSEMKTITSQYDRNDKSVENLSQQNDVLNKKIEEQEKKVSLLKDALKQSEEETGKNSQTTKSWQTELNNAQAELNKLNKNVESNKEVMDEAAKETKENADAVEEFGDEAEKSGKSALSLGDIIKANLISDVIKGGLQALANGVKAVGSAMAEAITNGTAYADNILTLSAQTGLSTDTLEKYNAVAELTDVSMETLTGSMAKNVKAMGEAQKGSAKYVEAYDKLGISVTDANGSLRDSETVYWETVDALKGIENETERDALAMELFGKKAQDLNTIIEMGSEGVKEYTDQAEKMGIVLGQEGLEALGNLDDQMQIFKSTTSGTGNILASAFAPALTDAMTEVNHFTGEINGLITAVLSGDGEGIEGAMVRVSEEIGDMVASIRDAVPQMMEVANSLISALVDTLIADLPWIAEQGVKILSSLLQGITKTISTIVPVVMSVITTLLQTIIKNLPSIVKMGVEVLVSLIQGITNTLPELIPLMVNTVVLIAETLLDNIDLVVDTGIDLILALTEGILDALPQLIDKVPTIIEKLVSAITYNLPQLLAMGVRLIVELGVGLVSAIPQLVGKIPSIISAIVKGLGAGVSSMANIGKNLLQGLWNGMGSLTDWLWSKVQGMLGSLTSKIKSFFGIASPSKLFKNEIGNNLALGVSEGFTDTMKNVTNDMTNAIPTEFDTNISTKVNSVSSASATSNFDMTVLAFKKALSEVKVFMNDREMGTFVTDTVERCVFA